MFTEEQAHNIHIDYGKGKSIKFLQLICPKILDILWLDFILYGQRFCFIKFSENQENMLERDWKKSETYMQILEATLGN